jgi:AcrR family transcriptional regulator
MNSHSTERSFIKKGICVPIDPVQEQLIAMRRTQILDAATSVFAEKGFHRTTIKDIAAFAGIADGTIYNYFANKNALLIGILDRLNQTEQREAHFTQVEDLRGFFIAYLQQRLEILFPNAEVFKAVLPELLTNTELRDIYVNQIINPSISIAENFLQSRIDQGEIHPIDVPLTVRTLIGVFLGLLMLDLWNDEVIVARWRELPDTLAQIILDGLLRTS